MALGICGFVSLSYPCLFVLAQRQCMLVCMAPAGKRIAETLTMDYHREHALEVRACA